MDKPSTPYTSWERTDRPEKEKDEKISKTVLEQITKEAFEIFEQDGHLNPHDLGTVIRSLGFNPSQQDVEQHVAELKDPETGKITLPRFQQKWVPYMLENKATRDSEDKIKRAFRILDIEKKGYIESDKLRALLTSQGEPFSKEEIDEMFATAVDHEKGVVFYNQYAAILAND